MSDTRVSDLIVYPIKSTAGLHLSQSLVEIKGMTFDRCFVVSKPNGAFITARTHPQLLQVHSALTTTGLHLRAPGMDAIDVNYHDFDQDYRALKIWGDKLRGQHCTEQLDQWFSQFLGEDAQLLFCGDETQRSVIDRVQSTSDTVVKLGEQLSFADAYPLLIASEASLDDLNKRMTVPVAMTQFRPNIVVKGFEAFAEDTWKKIRIGEVEFNVVHGCSRCIMTTAHPETSTFSGDKEPMTTLSHFRKGEDDEVYFGYNLMPLNSGRISLYDEVEILETKIPIVYEDNAPYLAQPTATQAHKVWRADEFTELECLSVRRESNNPSGDVKTFTFKTRDGSKPQYLAGQFLCLDLEIDGVPVYRNYTASSSPSRPDRVAITVKRVEGGKVSNWIHDNVKTGDSLRARAPSGDFHCFAAPQDKVLLLSAGSGITPMLSMLRWMTDMQLDNDIVFFHSAKTEADIIALEEVQFLARQHGRCQVFYNLTRETPEGFSALNGRLNFSMLLRIPELKERQVFVCGPHGFMNTAKELLTALGLPKTQYFEESFGSMDSDVNVAAKPINISFDSWDTYVEGDTTNVLLEQAEKAGLDIPFSCRGGFCGQCKVKLESGEVEQLETAGLTPQEEEQGYILSCSCLPKTDLVITHD